MSVGSALYQLFIGPLELLFEIIFALTSRVVDNPGICIIFLSLAVNFLVLPLYNRADAMQEEERETEKRLGHWVKHIKKTFKGDERYMMLQTYYRQNNYKPTYALKGSVSLLLEIPFFMAAYNFLSRLPALFGTSFGPIADLSVPDGMLKIGTLAINVLPILMTAINLVSSAIYTRGLSTKSKVQLYVMAGLFLVLLYDSPSGLVFYWTLNNVFSLVKNIIMLSKRPKRVVGVLSSALGAAGLVFILTIHPMPSMLKQIFVASAMLLMQLPLLIDLFASKRKQKKAVVLTAKDTAVFRMSGLLLAVLTGVLIPTAVMRSSPEEFINTFLCTSPLWYILHAALTAAGIFIVWFSVFYMLANPAGKKMMSLFMWLLAGTAAVNYMFFGTGYGTLSPNLTFVNEPDFSQLMPKLVNLLVLAAVCVLLSLLFSKKKELVRAVLLASCAAVIGMSAFNVNYIHEHTADKVVQLLELSGRQAEIPLSKENKNVVVIMLDRAISGYVPYIMNEKPELLAQFDGFTYYPNTISFGGHTNVGLPAVFGGYEYTPTEMNKRDTISLEEKHNEAMRLMPVLFDENGCEVTVCDPTYAGYDWIPDLSIYDDHPDINTFITMGNYQKDPEWTSIRKERKLNRDFFCYSLFKIAPVFLQPSLYYGGEYNAPVSDTDLGERTYQNLTSKYRAEGLDSLFLGSYTVLDSLPEMTRIEEGQKGTFLMMCNDTTHEPTLLKEPEYVPSEVIDNEAYDKAHEDRYVLDGRTLSMENDTQVRHYQVNMAAYLKLGEWFDTLREQGVYDNTRIILVSDHGYFVNQLEALKGFSMACGEWVDRMQYNPLLMIKDFDSTGFTTDRQFMTNADVPSMAMAGLIEAPINPFTGKKIDSAAKAADKQSISLTHQWGVGDNNGNTFKPDNWATVHDDIFEAENWELFEMDKK